MRARAREHTRKNNGSNALTHTTNKSALKGCYDAKKPPKPGQMGQDITDALIFLRGGSNHAPDAPFVKILELTKNMSGEVVVKVRPGERERGGERGEGRGRERECVSQ